MEQQLGHYRIIELIGRGGMGSVYKAHEMSLNRIVALKVLGEHLTEDETNISRFRREARSVAALNHPNVIQIYFIGEDKGQHFFVMEYVEGVTLKDLIGARNRPSVEESCALIRQAAVGLAAAHDRGLIHRDIKPANIMVNTDGIVKIADFGLAFRPEDKTKLTASGMFLGTPGYLAPEQCTGAPLDARTDIYALGMTLYELLVGRSAYGEDSLPPLALIHRVMHEQPADISQANPEVDSRVRAMVNRMIAKAPKDRYTNCHELLVELDGFLGPSQAFWAPTRATQSPPKPPSIPPVPGPGVPNAPTQAVTPSGDSMPHPVTPPSPVSVRVPGKAGGSMSSTAVIWMSIAAGLVLIAGVAAVIALSMQRGSPKKTEIRPQKLKVIQDENKRDDATSVDDQQQPFESNEFFIQGERSANPEPVQTGKQEPEKAPVREQAPSSKAASKSDTTTHEDTAAKTVAPSAMPSKPAPTNVTDRKAQSAKPRIPAEVTACLQKLRSADDALKREAAKIIIKRYPQNPRLLNAVRDELLAGHQIKPRENLHVDAMAWLCRALANSGNVRFIPTLEKVAAETKSRKIKKYARAGLKRLK